MCPGGIECSEEFHWVLIIFKMFGPYIIGLQLLPLIVKARIMHVHAHIKNFEVEMPLVQKEPEAPAPKKGKKKKGGKVEHAVEEEQKSLVTEEVKKEREIP